MRRTVRCWLGTVGAAAAAAWVLGQGGVASAAPAAGAVRSGPSRVSVQAYVPPHGYLYPGLHSTAVRDLQRRLGQLHYYPGPVNGTFDADTLEAVCACDEGAREQLAEER